MGVALPKSTKFFSSSRFLLPTFLTIGGIGLYLSGFFDNPYATTYPISMVSASIVFLLVKKGNYNFKSIESVRVTKLLMIIYFITLSMLPAVFIYNNGVRTDSAFLITVVLYTLLVLAIILGLPSTKGLFLIIITSIANRATAYYASSLYVGVDIYGHVRRTNGIITEGALSGIGPTKYYYSPFYHLLTGWGSLLFNTPLKIVIFLFITVSLIILLVLVAYIIGYQLVDEKVGLLSAVLLIGSDFAISWGNHAIPTSLGSLYFALTIFVAFKYIGILRGKANSKRHLFLYTLLLIVINFTHQLSLFVTITVLGAAFFGKALYDSKITSRIIILSLVSGLILYFNFTFTRYGGPASETTFFDEVVGGFTISILETSVNARVRRPVPDDPSLSLVGANGLGIVHVAGSAMLLAFGILGVLLWCCQSKKVRNPHNGFILGVASGIPMAITLAGPVFGLRNLLPFRWFVFLYLPLAILAAYGLLSIIEYFVDIVGGNPRLMASVVILILCLPLFTFMIGNFAAAQDGPYFDDDPGAQRLSTTDSELALYSHHAEYGLENRTTLADARAGPPLGHVGVNARNPVIEFEDPNTISENSYLVNRAYLRSKHAQYQIRYEGSTFKVSGAFPVDEVRDRRIAKVYDAGEDELLVIS